MNSLIPFAIIFNQALIIRCCGEDVIGGGLLDIHPPSSTLSTFLAPVAQPDRATVYGTVGCMFESCRVHWLFSMLSQI
jgi:hypothetical protein